MNKLNKTLMACSLVSLAIGAYAFTPGTGDDGHKVKVKIVKIVDGDTTVIEKTVDESEVTKMSEDLNSVKGKNVKVMMYVNSDEKGKDQKEESGGAPQRITMNKTFSFDIDSMMKTCKIELNIDSLIGSVMNGFNMTVITDDDKDGKGEKKVIIKKGDGKDEDVEIRKSGDDKDGNCVIVITGPDDKGGKKEEKVIIKKQKSGNGSYSYTIDSDEGDVNMDIDAGDDKDGKNSTIVITTTDKDGKNKKVIVKSSVIVIDDNDKPEGKKDAKKERESAEDLKFYPNPTSDGKFTVEYDLKSKETAQLTITDINGKVLFKDEIKGGGKYSKQVDLGGSGKGVFILNLQQGKKSISRKIVIE